MKRTKLEKPTYPTDQEQLFIDYIEKYGSLSENSLAVFVFAEILTESLSRKLRKYKEKYNNHKFINIVPQGEIHKYNGLYRLITPDDHNVRYYQLMQHRDFICACISKTNSKRNIGELQAKGQMSLENIINMDYNELITYQNQIDELMEGKDE